MTRQHDERCRCPKCRHARFAPGAPSGRDAQGRPHRKALGKANFYGHFTYHPKHQRTKGETRSGFFGGMPQASGPITFGAPDFVEHAKSTNKYRSAPGLTVRWLTP